MALEENNLALVENRLVVFYVGNLRNLGFVPKPNDSGLRGVLDGCRGIGSKVGYIRCT